jgi:2-hydroxychromene-2-carboxylate isomerase
MKHITFHLDFLSPYAMLAFERLPQALEGLSYSVDYRPVLLGALLARSGVPGPAEVEHKRAWVYRQAQWLAHAHGIALDLPAAHPFSPLPLLRLAIACGSDGAANRYVCETIFRHVWTGGGDALDAGRLAVLTERLAPARAPDAADVKAELRANTDAALAQGVFGVPSFTAGGRTLWGFDALPMLRAAVQGDAWFDGAGWQAAAQLPSGLPAR